MTGARVDVGAHRPHHVCVHMLAKHARRYFRSDTHPNDTRESASGAHRPDAAMWRAVSQTGYFFFYFLNHHMSGHEQLIATLAKLLDFAESLELYPTK